MPTNKQRREAARRHLERQLQRRQERDVARKRFVLIASIVGTLIIIAIIVVAVTMLSSDDKKTKTASSPTPTPSNTTTPANACGAAGSRPVPTATGTGPAVSFHGVTVKGAKDLAKSPSIGSTATAAPTKLAVKDLVVGKGRAATPKSTVNVKYTGVLYCDGTEFDGPAEHGDKAISFSLTRVVPGFTRGIGGTTGVRPMKVGGRRIIIMPPALGYGDKAQSSIPANSPLVFVVDLLSVKK